MTPLWLSHFTAVSSIGRGLSEIHSSLKAERTGLAPCAFETVDLEMHVGEVPGLDDEPLPKRLTRFDCRNNRLAELTLKQDGFEQAVAQCASRRGPQRVGVFLGTSTSGVLATELAYRELDPVTGALPAHFDYLGTHNAFSMAQMVRERFGLEGPAAVLCSACASSAKVFGAAQRLMEVGLIDAAVVGGVDSFCLTTLYGFHSLQLTSRGRCRPFDVARDGISIGEAGAFALLERAPGSLDPGSLLLLGVGESSDAHHMSSPQPEGRGARAAMLRALESSGLTAGQIDYINLHGTGTISNDSAESRAVHDVLGDDVPASSTKGATGHTLGAAGALEVVICGLALQHGFLPAGLNTTQIDPALTVHYLRRNQASPVKRVMSNSFGFGGSNCSLILGRTG
jgi:3-oxoacyl-[acyl-carrier-protein] synthase-1